MRKTISKDAGLDLSRLGAEADLDTNLVAPAVVKVQFVPSAFNVDLENGIVAR